MIGIYKIVNIKNNKVYIGKTFQNIKKRFQQHKYCLRSNKHKNPHLQFAWNYWKEESFEFLVEKECKVEELKYWEEYFIELYESWNPGKGYNIRRISEGVECVSEESKKKMSESKKGKYCGKNSPSFGRIPSKETREIWSAQRKGKYPSEETKRKIKKIREELYSGENAPGAKLTWEQVREIREKYIPRIYPLSRLAKEYNVCKKTILNVIKNRIWKE